MPYLPLTPLFRIGLLIALMVLVLTGCERMNAPLGTSATSPLLLKIQLKPKLGKVAKGTHFQLTATGIYQDDSRRDISHEVQWILPDNGIIQPLTKPGQFRAVEPGEGRIGVALGVIQADALVQVTDASLEQLQISPVVINLAQGNQTRLNAVGIFSDGSKQALEQQIDWRIEPEGLADLAPDNTLQARQPGSGELVARYTGDPGLSVSVPIEIVANTLSRLTLSLDEERIASGTRSPIVLTGTYDNGRQVDLSSQASWSVNPPASASIEIEDGRTWLYARQPGTVSVQAAVDGISDTLSLEISAARIESIDIVAERSELAAGMALALKALGHFSDGSVQDITRDVVWTSKNSDVVAVDANSGQLQAIAPGSTEVVALFDGLYDRLPVSVTPAILNEILLSSETLVLPTGDTLRLSATGVYSDGSRSDITARVSWISSDPDIIAIDNVRQPGLLSARASGQASVRASLDGIESRLDFRVSEARLTALTVEIDSRQMPAGTQQVVRAIGIYSDDSKRDLSDTVIWSSGDTNVLEIVPTGENAGLLQALATGTAQVVARLDELEATLAIEVTAASLQDIEITLPAQGLDDESDLIPITATGIFSDASRSDITRQVRWQSSSAQVEIILDPRGVWVTRPSEGQEVTLSATLDGISASIVLDPPPVTLARVLIEPPLLRLAAGDQQQLRLLGVYTDGSRQDLTAEALWRLGDTRLAQINTAGDAPGLLFALQAGSGILSASYRGYNAEAVLEISQAVLQRLEIQPPLLPWVNGNSQQLRVMGIYSDGSSRDLSNEANWSSDNPAVLDIDNGLGQAGLATAVGAGTVRVTAATAGLSDSIELTIGQEQLVALEITPNNPAVAKGSQFAIAVTGIYSNNVKQDLSTQVAWSLADDTIVVTAGSSRSLQNLRAQNEGQTQLTVSFAGISASTTIEVTPARLISLNIEGDTDRLAAGTATRLRALANYTDGSQQLATGQVDWSSSDDALAVIDATGRLTALQAGTVNITASLTGVTSTYVVEISDATLQQLSIEPASAVLAPGTRLGLRARGQFSDGSSQDLTEQVLWVSADEALAVVANGEGEQGQVSALAAAANPVRIDASLGEIVASSYLSLTDAPLQSIEIQPALDSLPYGVTLPLTAIARFADGSTQDITRAATWSLDDGGQNLASIDNTVDGSGRLTTVAPGTITVRARFDGLEASQALVISADPRAPVALVMAASPNVILNNGIEETLIRIYTRAADPSTPILDGSVVELEIIAGEAVLSATQVTTLDGQATFRLRSSYSGIVTVRARIRDSLVVNTLSVYATESLGNIIGRWALADPLIADGQLKAGSRFGLIIANFSNRPLSVLAFQASDSQAALESVTDPAYLSDGSLEPGEGTALLYISDADSSDALLSLAYLLRDDLSRELFTAGVTLTLNLSGGPP